MFNGLALNPAFAGSQEVLNLAALYRSSQWGNSMEGMPVTQTFAGDFPLRNPQLALGLLVFNDKISIFRQTGAYFAYAFRVKAGEGKLSFGLQAGFDLQHEDFSGIKIKDLNDELFKGEIHNSFMPNVGTGVYYNTTNVFAGLSGPQLLAYSPNTANSYKGKPTLSNIMLYSGVVVPAGHHLKVKPSVLLQNVGSGLLLDVNCNFALFREMLEFGASWRNSNTLVGMVQYRIHSFCIGYAHDYAIGKPNAINTSHEIMLRYNFRIMVDAVNPLHLK
jgi:type IX secretion system PorP/SprF family membrane protein